MLLLSMVLLVTAVAGVGAVAVASITDDVHILVDGLRPAAYSNLALRNDMAAAQSSVRGYALTGDRRFLERYRTATADAGDELARLASLVEGDPRFRAPFEEQKQAVTEWFAFAEGLVLSETRVVAADYLWDGQASFDRFVECNDVVSEQVNAGIEQRGGDVRERSRWTIALVVIVSLLGLLATALLGRTVVRRVSGPLRDVEAAVERLAAGDLDARVNTDGPREITRVATALNTLAEENQRAREMEEQVVGQLKQLDRAKDEFVSTVSHELRTPLTSISGYLELLEDDFADTLDDHQRTMVEILKRNVGRLRSLIEDLLTLSRVESAPFRTTFDLLDLRLVAADAARDAAEAAARSGVLVRPSQPARAVLVRGDAVQLSRAMLNLLTNAIKFSPPGSEVRLGLTECDGTAVVSVDDDGIGIPAPELATLGTRFFRASNAVQAEITGTGLGLRIVQTIADNHGGRLELESAVGQGTSARLIVPTVRDADHRNIPVLEDISEG